MANVRWDGDERGKGVADARALAPGAGELADAMRTPNWVAERPDVHLLPHVERACESLPLDVAGTRTSAAESATYVRQRRVDPADASGGALLFEIVTGFLPSDTAFVPHGHSVRVSVSLT